MLAVILFSRETRVVMRILRGTRWPVVEKKAVVGPIRRTDALQSPGTPSQRAA